MKCENCGAVFQNKYSTYSDGRFCSKMCARAFSTRAKRQEINTKVSKKLTRVSYGICEFCGKEYKKNKKHQKFCCLICASKSNSKRIFRRGGGYRKNSGKGKMGWYKGIHCQSSWELAFLLYSEYMGIKVERCKQVFEYIYNGKKYKYYPDFECSGQIFEIKGFLREKDAEKISQCPVKITVLDKKAFKPILDFVVKKYGTDFVRLYE